MQGAQANKAQEKLRKIQQLVAQLEKKVPKHGPNWVAIEIGGECGEIRRLCQEISVLVGTGDSPGNTGFQGTGFQGTGKQ